MRLIDADALKAEWYKINDIGPEDCGARFVGYQEIARLIDNAPTVEPTGDYISRADAIEAVAQEWLSEASAESPYVNDDDIGEYRKLAEELFEDVPSAEAEWIPCSERLPDVGEIVIASWSDLWSGAIVFARRYCEDDWKWAYEQGSDYWESARDYDRESNPEAWMPLPKPYREDGEA